MARWMLPLLAAAALLAQSQGDLKTRGSEPAPAADGPIQVPPEEDKTLTVESYSFNPLQSKKDVTVGNEYWKAGNYHAAEWRFRDATKWNNANSEAWLRLAEAAEKSKDPQTAKEAYAKYLKLEPDAKDAGDVRKKLAKLK